MRHTNEFEDDRLREIAREIKYGPSPLEAMTDEELAAELERAELVILELELGDIAMGRKTPDELAEEAARFDEIWDSI